jgi:Putative adhesin
MRSIPVLTLTFALLISMSGPGTAGTEHEKEKEKTEYKYEYHESARAARRAAQDAARAEGPTETDTTIAVKTGARLQLTNFGGTIEVKTWDKSSVRIEAEHSSRVGIEVEQDEGTLEVRSSGRWGGMSVIDYVITVPAWMGLELGGVNTEISVAGTRGDVKAETVSGDVTVSGGKGYIELSSFQGDVHLSGSSGKASITAVNNSVTVETFSGELTVENVNGDVELDNVDAITIDAGTVNGGVHFKGKLRADGRYRLATHNGDIAFEPVGPLHAVVTVATFNGDFESAFPVTIREARRGKRFTFTVGNGGATVELESFEGTIRLGQEE